MKAGAEPLNFVFGDCLVKYIDVLGRKGCSRTALEFNKLLLGLSPQIDFNGALLRIDFYATRAREYNYLIDLVEHFDAQVYGKTEDDGKISCVKLLPNLLMSSALACKHVCKAEEAKNHNVQLEDVVKTYNDYIETGKVRNAFKLDEDARV